MLALRGFVLFLLVSSSSMALAAPIATLLSDNRGGSIDIQRQLRNPSTLDTTTFDTPDSSFVTDGFQHGNGPGGAQQENVSPFDNTILESLFTDADYLPSAPGIGGKFNAITMNVFQSIDMTSTGFEASNQLHLVGNLSLSATEQFSVATSTPWSWDTKLTQIDNNDSVGGIYQFSLKNSSNVTIGNDANGTFDGTDHTRQGTLAPGTYTMTFTLSSSQAYAFTQAGQTHTTITGNAIFSLPEPGMTAMAGMGMALLAGRRRK